MCSMCEEEIQGETYNKVVKIPNMPSQEEIDQHMTNHVPFRSWCPHCVAGQAQPSQHRRRSQEEEENGVPTVSMDYMFMSSREKGDGKREENQASEDQDEERGMPILVVSDHDSGMAWADVVVQKGKHPFLVMRVGTFCLC